eukprot:1600818-Pyramimonas_sp.AAC.1
MYHASPERLQAWGEEAEGSARVLERKVTSGRSKRWRERVQEAVPAGAGKAHTYSQSPIGWAPPALSTIKSGGCAVPLGPQESVDGLAKCWREIPGPALKPRSPLAPP